MRQYLVGSKPKGPATKSISHADYPIKTCRLSIEIEFAVSIDNIATVTCGGMPLMQYN
jgi:hypothetical protein